MLVRLALMPLRPIFAVPVPVERGLPGSSKAADTSSSACWAMTETGAADLPAAAISLNVDPGAATSSKSKLPLACFLRSGLDSIAALI